jgi:hypothetical protein
MASAKPHATGVATIKRILAKEQVEDRLVFMEARFPVTIRHRELIQIGEQRGIRVLNHGSMMHYLGLRMQVANASSAVLCCHRHLVARATIET